MPPQPREIRKLSRKSHKKLLEVLPDTIREDTTLSQIASAISAVTRAGLAEPEVLVSKEVVNAISEALSEEPEVTQEIVERVAAKAMAKLKSDSE